MHPPNSRILNAVSRHELQRRWRAIRAAMRERNIDALVVQNPYFFGYQGVLLAGMAIVNRIPPRDIDPGAVVADKANMNQPDVRLLLEPPTAKAGS